MTDTTMELFFPLKLKYRNVISIGKNVNVNPPGPVQRTRPSFLNEKLRSLYIFLKRAQCTVGRTES